MPTNHTPAAPYLLLTLLVFTSACGSSEDEPAQRPLVTGDISTWAGTGTQGHDGDGHHRLQSWFNQPMELAFSSDGSALVVDWNNHAIRRITSQQTLVNVIGQALPGDWPCQVPLDPTRCDTPLSAALSADQVPLNHPTDVAADGTNGSFFVAAWHNHKIERYDAITTNVTVLAGAQKPGASGDGGPSAAALLNFPSSLVTQPDGSLLISDERNNRVRRIAGESRTVSTAVGAPPGQGGDGDEIAATTLALALTTSDEVSGADNPPAGGALALSANGELYVADTFHHCVRRIRPGADGLLGVGDPLQETAHTVAGTCGQQGYGGDGGAAANALLNRPFDLELGPDGALYIADTGNHRVRRVSLEDGGITTVAGTGEPGFSGDGGPATAARLREPYGLAFDGDGALLIVDTLNNRIRRITP